MKQYNTMTMLNMLIENPDLRFENSHKTVFVSESGNIYIEYKNDEWLTRECFMMTNQNINALWTMVRNPVDFMTAFNAFKNENKNIFCERNGMKTYYSQYPKDSNTWFDGEDIDEGNWYIND